MTDRLKVYACGGCGINQASMARATVNSAVSFTYIDTSRSNLNEAIKEEEIYLIPDVDGSGSIRAENAKAITELVPDILLKHKPGQFNIVVGSGAGGSGSVITPLLVNTLLKQGLPVIVILTGTSESGIRTTNTLDTLTSLAKLSDIHQQPITIVYEDNMMSGMTRQTVDVNVVKTMEALWLILAHGNRELDSADLTNWLLYNRPTKLAPSLVELQLFNTSESLVESGNRPVSMVSLFKEPNGVVPPVMPDYNAVGYCDLLDTPELHAALIMESVQNLSKFVMDRASSIREVQGSRRVQPNMLLETASSDDFLQL